MWLHPAMVSGQMSYTIVGVARHDLPLCCALTSKYCKEGGPRTCEIGKQGWLGGLSVFSSPRYRRVHVAASGHGERPDELHHCRSRRPLVGEVLASPGSPVRLGRLVICGFLFTLISLGKRRSDENRRVSLHFGCPRSRTFQFTFATR
jgi:hypothetical protein